MKQLTKKWLKEFKCLKFINKNNIGLILWYDCDKKRYEIYKRNIKENSMPVKTFKNLKQVKRFYSINVRKKTDTFLCDNLGFYNRRSI